MSRVDSNNKTQPVSHHNHANKTTATPAAGEQRGEVKKGKVGTSEDAARAQDFNIKFGPVGFKRPVVARGSVAEKTAADHFAEDSFDAMGGALQALNAAELQATSSVATVGPDEIPNHGLDNMTGVMNLFTAMKKHNVG